MTKGISFPEQLFEARDPVYLKSSRGSSPRPSYVVVCCLYSTTSSSSGKGYFYNLKSTEDFNDCLSLVDESLLESAEELYRRPEEPEESVVDHPKHYVQEGSIECIDYIESFLSREEFIGYLRGNIAKYLHRFRYKNQSEDLAKAQWYLTRLKDFYENST